MQSNSVKDVVFMEMAPIVATFGYELVEVDYVKKPNGMNLTLFIDGENGVDLEGLEKVHRAVDSALDELDPTHGAPYILNCSSLGLDRPIKTDRDLTRNIGKMIDVSLYAKQNGVKEFEGELVSFSENSILIKTQKDEVEIPREAISKIKKHISF